jgi:hypothetical protein
MYFATVVCPTSMPSLRSSPWMRGAPQSGFATLMSRMSWRMSAGVFGRPPTGRDFERQCGYPVDGQMDCLHHALVGIAGPMTLQQFDLYMVERIEVGEAILDRARQQRILVEQCLLAGDREQHFNCVLPFGTQPRKDSFA